MLATWGVIIYLSLFIALPWAWNYADPDSLFSFVWFIIVWAFAEAIILIPAKLFLAFLAEFDEN